MESSFGVEGVLAGVAAIEQNGWVFAVESEILLNQPYDANQLADDPERSSYLGNFDTDTLEISQLMLSARYGDLLVGIGKMVSPFGRTAFPIYSNDQRDAPFIRTESISWRETGVLLQVDPSIFVLTLAAVNGTEDKDTNSTKGLIGRTGIDLPWFSAGASFKVQDGIGSENQKMYQDHYGVDAALRWGRFCLSGEAIYDEYGAHEHGFDPDTITWDRGIYYREQNLSLKESIHGFGYYVNLGYDAERWTCSINYGEFFPEQIGDPLHDATTHRLLGKMAWRFVDAAEIYVAAIMEDDVENAQMGKDREGSYWLAGLQVGF